MTQSLKDALAQIELQSARLVRTGDSDALMACVEALPGIQEHPEAFNGVFWSLMNRMFSGKVKIAPDRYEHVRQEHLAPAWLRFVESIDTSQFSPLPQRDGEKPRIALVVHQVLTPGHAPTAYVLDVAREMTKGSDAQVLLVNSNAYPRRHESPFQEQMIGNVNPHLKGLQTLDYQGTPIKTYSASETAMGSEKISNCLKAIHDFAPDLVFTYGAFNIMGDLASKFAPTLLIPSTREEPIGRAHIMLGAMPWSDTLFNARQSILPFQPVYEQTSFGRTVPERTKTITREDLGIGAEETVFVVVGNRLKSEIDRSFEAAMADILTDCPNASFLIVGLAYRKWKDKRMAALKSRVRFIKYEQDLRALYQCCDVFFNPERQGGGLSAIMALSEGRPCLATRGDVASLIGPGATMETFAAQIETAKRIALEPSYAQEKREEAQAIFAARPSFESFVQSIVSARTRARAVFEDAARLAA